MTLILSNHFFLAKTKAIFDALNITIEWNFL